MACSQTQVSHTDTAKIVVESFYEKKNTTLKKHTTDDSYASFMSIQNVMAPGDTEVSNSNFKVLNETSDGETAWVQFSSAYAEKPETFKLVMQDGKWLVTEKGLREKSPF
ncbi:hypothetical protein [uncultured Aquimarina sp.]|uniref:hypothetical protein n=1 Tax=uncultured Aquimarina sp. TaxID=575652 RepID=UPI00260F9D25|nr:hypothetical protein [uncultured Aquimarina sp.]